MSVFLGFYRPDPEYLREAGVRRRAGDSDPDPRLTRLVVELTDKLPASCTVLGAYNTMAGNVLSEPGPPGVIVVETNNGEDLFFISQYYAGYLQFVWHPARSLGTTRQEREAAVAGTTAGVGARR